MDRKTNFIKDKYVFITKETHTSDSKDYQNKKKITS